MINPIAAYYDCGRRAAQARNENDEARAKHEAEWFRKARDLEQGDARTNASDAYHRAYRATRRI